MQLAIYNPKERVIWFSMWFLASIATFGVTFFPMFYRLIDGRNRHFNREAELEQKIINWLKQKNKPIPQANYSLHEMNAKTWAASIILIIPSFFLLYNLSKDLREHELYQEKFLDLAFTEKMFMPQTISIKKYVIITIATLGIGGIYWLYKVVNLYNAHFKAQWQVEKELTRLMEAKS
ncbi:MAG: DUF4234 domain-containing protein [Crenarchaeota archaeon]|nr:DUF4234 domain-containing protein [Thermoproteota archaeon]